MFVLRVIFFLVASMVNVQVKAKVLEEPLNCWQLDGHCAVKSLNSQESLTLSSAIIDFTAGSIWKRYSEESLRLVKGSFFIRSIGEVVVNTKYVSLNLKPKQSVLVTIDYDKVVLTAFEGDLEALDLLAAKYILPQGYVNWFGKVTARGIVDVGFPRAANFKKVIQQLSTVSSLSQTELYNKLKGFRSSWIAAINETQDRSIASAQKLIKDEQELLQRQAERRRLQAIERKKMREFIFRKTFLE